MTGFAEQGWQKFPAEPATLRWVAAVRPFLGQAVVDPAGDWRCGGTWMVGVDALPNRPDGSVAGVALGGQAIAAAMALSGPVALHPAQLSVTRPGYPRPSERESEAAFGYRLRRDAAHVDGLMAEGPDKRRFLREPHAWILGIALTTADADAAPLTVWDGSHRPMGAALGTALAGAGDVGAVDVTDAYQTARRTVFAANERRQLPLLPGEAVLMHRHLLHGVAPWEDGARAAPEGRAIAYFRPQFSRAADWIR